MAGCPVIGQSVYLERHNTVASAVHWNLSYVQISVLWLHQLGGALNNSDHRLLYDFNIFTDHKVTAQHPDLVVIDKQLKYTKLIDIACMMDCYVVGKNREKIEKYLVLAVELQTLWNTQIEIVLLVSGSWWYP